MLIMPKSFQAFIPGKAPSDTSTTAEVLNALAVGSRAEVDEMIDNVISLGGSEYRTKQDYGWMYSRAFQDVDGHIWESFYIDASQIPENPSQPVDPNFVSQ
ncbi:MAG: glyoxalase/bleomycin resistance/extradiol dioxygenase family protein [Candidatus Moraniibacteriota bacterium]